MLFKIIVCLFILTEIQCLIVHKYQGTILVIEMNKSAKLH